MGILEKRCKTDLNVFLNTMKSIIAILFSILSVFSLKEMPKPLKIIMYS